jgi:hypothetical protein
MGQNGKAAFRAKPKTIRAKPKTIRAKPKTIRAKQKTEHETALMFYS